MTRTSGQRSPDRTRSQRKPSLEIRRGQRKVPPPTTGYIPEGTRHPEWAGIAPPHRCYRGVVAMLRLLLGTVPPLLVAGLLVAAEEKKSADQGESLFNGKDLSGWKLIDPKAADRSKWSVTGGVRL